MGAWTTPCGGKARAPSHLVRSAHGHWRPWAHLLPAASHLPAGASTNVELPEQRTAYRNDSRVLAVLRNRTDRVLPAVCDPTRHTLKGHLRSRRLAYQFRRYGDLHQARAQGRLLQARRPHLSRVSRGVPPQHHASTYFPIIPHWMFQREDHLVALRFATSQQIHVSALADGWDISPWSKWISLRTSSSHMVKCHGLKKL